MAKDMQMMNDDELDQVNGGFMYFDYPNQALTYTHEETGEVTHYQVLNFEMAWKESNRMHGENKHEDVIIDYLRANGWIA